MTAMSPQSHLARSNLSSDLVTAVVQMIGERGLERGMKLDSQRDLAAHFGVAVPTMREALRRLEGMGVLSFRHGSGIYVGENFNRSVVPNIALPNADTQRLVELIEARALIEPAIAAEAAETREAESITRLQQQLDLARDCLQRQDPQLWKVNVDLHRAIAAVSGNRIVEEVLDSLLIIHAEDQRQILHLHGDPQADFAEHEQLVHLISAGKSKQATELMREHLMDVARAIQAPS